MSISKRDQLLVTTTITLCKLAVHNLKSLCKEKEDTITDFHIMRDATVFVETLMEHLCKKYIPEDVRVATEARKMREAVERTIKNEISRARGKVF